MISKRIATAFVVAFLVYAVWVITMGEQAVGLILFVIMYILVFMDPVSNKSDQDIYNSIQPKIQINNERMKFLEQQKTLERLDQLEQKEKREGQKQREEMRLNKNVTDKEEKTLKEFMNNE